jgi:xanthine dehydrogenase accessory factor
VLIPTDYLADEAALREALASPARYIGVIGSRAKCQTIRDRLRADGYGEAELARVYAPIGLDLGGHTPAEIALAILAEIEAVRRGKLTGEQDQVKLRREPWDR